MKKSKDERKGKPSASNGESYEACNGKHLMEAGLEDNASPAAEEGNRIHLWCEDQTAIELLEDELELAKEMISQRDMVMGMVFPDWRENPPPTIVKEQRLWYRQNRFSGKADFVAVDGKSALLVDYKCGRIPVTHARENGQMRWNVALLDHIFSFDSITVAVIQPRCGAPTIHTFDDKAVKKLRYKVTSALRLMEGANPRLRAGEKQCKYCKAKEFCPELNKKQEAIIRVADAEVLTPTQLSVLLTFLPAVEAKCKAVKAHAKQLLEDNPNAIAGWQLSVPYPTRFIGDPKTAFQKLEDESLIAAEGFLASCSVSVTKLQKEVVEHTGVGPTEAKRMIKTALGTTMEEKLREPSIKKAV